MKIIDLLNKIANGEEVPKKIKFENYIYNWRNMQKDYFCEKINHSLESIIGEYLFNNLNLEVEIIEEDKDIEKIEVYEDSDGNYFYDKHCHKIYITCDEINFMFEQFNELIDAVNKLKKGD